MSSDSKYPVDQVSKCIEKLYRIQLDFYNNYSINDIFSNSKFYEIIIANQLKHTPIPGHSGSRDATDDKGNEYEYKHFKETSSNHSWTFNDYSDNLINHMHEYTFIFAHINDKDYKYPGIMDWYYKVDGQIIKDYLREATKKIKNTRKMINVSALQLDRIGCKKTFVNVVEASKYTGTFKEQLTGIASVSEELERITKVEKILTSNKLYELLVAMELGHFVNSEQGGRLGAHDAFDEFGNTYEYKVYKKRLWNFQDISDTVLEKYYLDKYIFLAIVDKMTLEVKEIYSVEPKDAVPKLKEKLNNKIRKHKTIRRKQVSLTYHEVKQFPSFKIILQKKA